MEGERQEVRFNLGAACHCEEHPERSIVEDPQRSVGDGVEGRRPSEIPRPWRGALPSGEATKQSLNRVRLRVSEAHDAPFGGSQ